MTVLELLCPHCSVRLRLRDHSYVGRTISCPDCRRSVAIVKNAAGEVECLVTEQQPIVAATEPAPPLASSSTASPPVAAPLAARSRRQGIPPRAIGWGLAGVVVLLTIAVVFQEMKRPIASQPTVAVSPSGDGASVTNESPAAAVVPEQTPPKESPPDAVTQRMQTLGDWVLEYRQKHGVYPTVSPAAREREQREALGWMAELVAGRDANGLQPLWDRPLHDPLNARFVRRRMPEFLNPVFESQAAAEGFPASHFAGVAGVGADAADLPHDHPRAGMFGWNRRTSLEDIRDGAANVMMIAGVRTGFRPWAAGGEGTIRGLTQEPYINGPDGFGTGQANGMAVLMADGSVRFLSKEMSPVVLRRLAAMNDGLPLDPAVAGEPGEKSSAAMPAVGTPGGETPPSKPEAVPMPPDLRDRPIDVPIARDQPPKPVYEVDRALGQTLLRFSQDKPAQVIDLLYQLEELAGVPFHLEAVANGPEASRLEQTIALSLQNTTVRQVLEELLSQAELGYTTSRDFGIRIVPKAPK